MKGLRDLSLAGRIYLLSGAAVLIFLLMIGWLLLQLRGNLYESRKQEIRHLVESGWHVLDFYSRQAETGALSYEEAQNRALQVLQNQPSEKGTYLWLGDLNGAVVMHPFSSRLEERELTGLKDASGRPVFRDMVDAAGKGGEGFFEYLWPRPDGSEPTVKLSYVKGYPAWGWLIGAGYYVGDIEREVSASIALVCAVLLPALIGAWLLVNYLARSISGPMARAVIMIEALERGELGHRLRLEQRDEVGRLARAMDAFADTLEHEILNAFDHLARGDFSFEAQGMIQAPLARANTRLNAMCAELKAALAGEQEDRAKVEALIAAIGEGVAIFDSELRFIYQNRAHIDIAGNHVGEPCSLADQHGDHSCSECALALSLADGLVHRMERVIRSGGREIHMEVTASPVRDASGVIVSIIEIARNVTARRQAEARVEYLAFHDSLTGLPNRALVEERLTQALAHARRVNETGALFFIDLDRFKVINDSLGHDAGDLLLRQVGNRLTAMVRETDTVCRSGGDEFILLFPQVSPTDAAHLAEKVLENLELPFIVEGREIVISPSIGISLYPDDGADFSTLSRNADAAMYLAKDQGRNNFQFFKPDLTHTAQERLSLENELRKALAGDELQLYYQPQFDAATGEVVGAEALVRWHHHQRGWISPAQFIPVAEESGLIEPLGTWVLRTACSQNKRWQRCGYLPIRMAVNVSGRQFRQKGFIDTVDRILEETGLDPRWLELEVTENIIMENVEQTIMTLTDLKVRNISLAIDDFGTGYSSLSYLRQFPIDRLKIDRSFVAEVNTNADDAAIATAVIGLARTLNLEVVAEGVETAEQALFLSERQCDVMQGYYFGRPSPPEELSRLFEKRRLASVG